MKFIKVTMITILLINTIEQTSFSASPISPNPVTNAQYLLYIKQATAALTPTPNIVALSNNLVAAAKIDPAGAIILMMDKKPFSQAQLSKIFNASDLQSLGTAVFTTATGRPAIATGILYSSKGIVDDTFIEAAGDIDTGLENGNADLVVSGLQTIAADTRATAIMSQITALMTDPNSLLNQQLISNFNPTDLEKIAATANVSPAEIQSRLVIPEETRALVERLDTAEQAGNVDQMVNALSQLKGFNDNQIALSFENGKSLDFATLNEKFGLSDLSKIATAAGLSPSDVTLYVTGNYTSATASPNQFNTGSGINAKNLPNGSAYTELNGYLQQVNLLGGIDAAAKRITQLQQNIEAWSNQLATLSSSETEQAESLKSQISEAQAESEGLSDAVRVQTGIEDV